MSDVLPPVVEDERRIWRKRVLRTGKVVYGDKGEFSLDCRIHDLSASGARIALRPNECIPTRFYLVDAQSGIAYEAETSWVKVLQTTPYFGLKFTGTHKLDYLSDCRLHFLKRFAFRA